MSSPCGWSVVRSSRTSRGPRGGSSDRAALEPPPWGSIPPEWQDAPGGCWSGRRGGCPMPGRTPRADATVAVGWQGPLRELGAGRAVRHLPPSATPIVRRADLVGDQPRRRGTRAGLATLAGGCPAWARARRHPGVTAGCVQAGTDGPRAASPLPGGAEPSGGRCDRCRRCVPRRARGSADRAAAGGRAGVAAAGSTCSRLRPRRWSSRTSGCTASPTGRGRRRMPTSVRGQRERVGATVRCAASPFTPDPSTPAHEA